MNKGCIILLTGLPCSGKTTIAKALYTYLFLEEYKVHHMDGDTFRKEHCKDLGFSKEDRAENLQRFIIRAMCAEKNGCITICSFIAPYKIIRENIRKLSENFIEVFVDCDLEKCIERDVKGMYAKAIKGEIKNFTGISDPYEKPKNPEIICNTNIETVRESGLKILKYLEENKII